ncbi:MAG: TlpA family protein disulfide reductase [Acidimicrobiales bacterium]
MTAGDQPPAPDPEVDDSPPAAGAKPRRVRRWVVACAAAAAVLAVAGLTFGQGSDDAGPKGRPGRGQAPAIDLPDLDGEGTVSLASYGGRPVVVNLFASWCVPCRKELPAFQAVSDELKERVVFLGVNHQDNRQGGREMLSEAGVRYPAGYDPDGTVASSYGLFGMPSTLFVAPDGRLLETHTGELSRQQLEQTIERLFRI